MDVEFSSDFFKGNREKLKKLFSGRAPIVLTGAGIMQRNSDNEYPFRQDSNFWYLTGVDIHNVVFVMGRSKEYLIVPDRDPVVEAFDGEIDFEELKRVSGIDEILTWKEGWKKLGAKIKKSQHIATLAPPVAFFERFGLYTNPARASLVNRLKEINPDIEILDLRPHLTKMRAIKQPVELEVMQAAIDITAGAIDNVRKKLGKYNFEYEIEADITCEIRKKGATGHAFSPIVASGKNTSIIHHVKNDSNLKDARHVYFDIGAEYNHYSADLARTYFLKEPNKREIKIYQSVEEIRDHAKSHLRPGVIPKEYEKQMENFVGEKLRELGLIDIIEKEQVRKYFPHAMSHGLGLDPHDSMDYEAPLEAGMVITIEPGIYIPSEDIGVRIEDVGLITSDGVKVLSSDLAGADILK